jgi:multidrug efflux pump subunit AcrA (membrane-fusion protein)
VLRRASEETGASIAWLTPLAPAAVPVNEFVYANIFVRVKRRALTVPQAAVLVRDGRLFVVTATTTPGKAAREFKVVEVSTGAASGPDVELRSGLSAGEQVVVQGGVGFLYPDFKSSGGGGD